MPARLRLDADSLITAIGNFLDAARQDLSPEDHQRVLEAVVDQIDERLEAQEHGLGAAFNLPATP